MIKDVFIPVSDPGKICVFPLSWFISTGRTLVCFHSFYKLCCVHVRMSVQSLDLKALERRPVLNQSLVLDHELPGLWVPPGGCDCPLWSPCSCCFTDPCRDTVTPLFPSPFMQHARVRPFHHEHCRPFCSQDFSSYIFSIFEPFTLLLPYKYTVIFPLIIGEQQSWMVILISWQESELFIW